MTVVEGGIIPVAEIPTPEDPEVCGEIDPLTGVKCQKFGPEHPGLSHWYDDGDFVFTWSVSEVETDKSETTNT